MILIAFENANMVTEFSLSFQIALRFFLVFSFSSLSISMLTRTIKMNVFEIWSKQIGRKWIKNAKQTGNIRKINVRKYVK